MRTPRPKSPLRSTAGAQRALTRSALQRQLDELFAIFDGIEGAVYVADMQTYEILAVNRYMTAQFGPDLVGRKCYEIFQAGHATPCPFCTNAQLLGPDGQPAPPVVWEVQNTRNQRWYQCIDRAIHWPDGRLVRMEIAIDIDERKRSNEASRAAREMLRQVLDSIPQRVFWKDRLHYYRGSNRAYVEDLARLGVSQFVGRTAASMPLPPDVVAMFHARERAVMDSDQPELGLPVSFALEDGRHIHSECNLIPLHGADGQVTGVLGTFDDVTERHAAEARLIELQAELNHVARLANLGALLASIAHELNQPLSAIAGFASACRLQLENGSGARAELLSDLDAIAEQAQRAGAIIRRVREMVRKREPRRLTALVGELVHEVLQILRGELRIAQVRVRTEVPADLPPVLVDAVEVQQVLINLLTNAAEAMRGTPPAQRELHIHAAPADAGRVLVAVRDRGHGLTPEVAGRVFDPFFTTKPEGMGMGLAISRMLVEAHGGRLWAEPNLDGGATFCFTLPGVAASSHAI